MCAIYASLTSAFADVLRHFPSHECVHTCVHTNIYLTYSAVCLHAHFNVCKSQQFNDNICDNGVALINL